MNTRYAPNHWGQLYQFQVPHCIVQDGRLILTPKALSILIVLLQLARASAGRNRQLSVEVKISHKTLERRSGVCTNTAITAIHELEEKCFLRVTNDKRRKGGLFGGNTYTLCNPADGEPLLSGARNFLLRNKIQYISMPKCIVSESGESWSLAELSSSQRALWVGLCWLANRHNSVTLNVHKLELQTLTGISSYATLGKALTGLEDKRLIWNASPPASRELSISLCDPNTGEPPHKPSANPKDDPANYYLVGSDGRGGRVNLNSSSPPQVESLVRSCLPSDATVLSQANGDLKSVVPFTLT